jgi:hypothetical protein
MSTRSRATGAAVLRLFLMFGILSVLAHGFGHAHAAPGHAAEHHAADHHEAVQAVAAPAHHCGEDADTHSHRDERPRLVPSSAPFADTAPALSITVPIGAASLRPEQRLHEARSGAERLLHLCVSRI